MSLLSRTERPNKLIYFTIDVSSKYAGCVLPSRYSICGGRNSIRNESKEIRYIRTTKWAFSRSCVVDNHLEFEREVTTSFIIIY